MDSAFAASLQKYYNSLESRIGYWLILGNTRHFGWYEEGTWSPFPIAKAHRAMEDLLFRSLKLPPGSTVLDAGCGSGYVAIRMAQHGLNVQGIDIVERHIRQARRYIAKAGFQKQIQVSTGDYHQLTFPDASLDGVYTMETIVHSTDPKKVFKEFMRVLRPGGRLALLEYDFMSTKTLEKTAAKYGMTIEELTSCAMLDQFSSGLHYNLLQEVGFVDIQVKDISANVLPLVWLFYILAIIPSYVIRFLGLHRHFRNTLSAVHMWEARDEHRYISISARKPEVREAIVEEDTDAGASPH